MFNEGFELQTINRNYQDELGDFNLICRFIQENNSQIRKYSTWCIGRLVDWKYSFWGNKLTTPGFHTKNAQLWFDGFGNLAGFAISENGSHEIAIITAEGYRFLFDEIVDWALKNWGD